MRVAERMVEPYRVDREGVEIAQVGGDGLAQLRALQQVVTEYADPTDVVVLLEKAFGIVMLEAAATVEQEPDRVMLLGQDLARGLDTVDRAHIPSP
jgi:sulfur transfer complex TusBCD TusB component (DsrH family)